MLLQQTEKFTPGYTNSELRAFALEFQRDGYVKLPHFFTAGMQKALKLQVSALQNVVRSKHFVMPGYQTPRHMHTMGGTEIRQHSAFISDLYNSPELVAAINDLTGDAVRHYSNERESVVLNVLQQFGDTHGWHLDDPEIALVAITEAPSADQGGVVEYIPNWRALCEQHGAQADTDVLPMVDLARSEGLIKARHHMPGDAYLIRADQCLHRVTLLVSSIQRRAAINMAFELGPPHPYGNTAELLYN